MPPQLTPAVPPAIVSPRTIDSADLMQGNREIYIHHHGEIYRLSVTKNGKLILHK